MGILKRMKRSSRASANNWLDRREEPLLLLNEYTREMEQEMEQAQAALSRQIFMENKHATLLQDTDQVIAKRERQAKLALEHDDEDMARLAVEEKLRTEQQRAAYQHQYEQILQQTRQLKAKMAELHEHYGELQHRKSLLAARANVAQSMLHMQSAAHPVQTDAIMRGVGRAEDQVLLMESRVQAGHLSPATQPIRQHSDIPEDVIQQELAKLRESHTSPEDEKPV